ncbi:MAG: hypothetical protein V2I51_23265 [Anderseniella sp.]|jgi:hypothetical protein|nr:hypothetical protein [Anderseniella sp.]
MTLLQRLAVAAAMAAALAGCGTTTGVDTSTTSNAPADDGLSGTPAQFERMADPCFAQAARMTGLNRGAIVVTDRIRTGGGPLLTLNAGARGTAAALKTTAV